MNSGQNEYYFDSSMEFPTLPAYFEVKEENTFEYLNQMEAPTKSICSDNAIEETWELHRKKSEVSSPGALSDIDDTGNIFRSPVRTKISLENDSFLGTSLPINEAELSENTNTHVDPNKISGFTIQEYMNMSSSMEKSSGRRSSMFQKPSTLTKHNMRYEFVIEDPSSHISTNSEISECNSNRRHSVNTSHLYCCPWPHCNKVFNRFYNLRSHYRIHSGEKPFNCKICNSSFARNHDLKRHERIHSKTKEFECLNCNKSFSRNDALNRHRRLNSCSK